LSRLLSGLTGRHHANYLHVHVLLLGLFIVHGRSAGYGLSVGVPPVVEETINASVRRLIVREPVGLKVIPRFLQFLNTQITRLTLKVEADPVLTKLLQALNPFGILSRTNPLPVTTFDLCRRESVLAIPL
jgi:hypothetical protein